MMFSITNFHPSLAMLAFFQGTQLSLFERFLTQAYRALIPPASLRECRTQPMSCCSSAFSGRCIKLLCMAAMSAGLGRASSSTSSTP